VPINVEVRLECEVVGGGGEMGLDHLVVRDGARGVTETVPAQLLFVRVGALPRTDWLAGTLARDPRGFLLTGDDLDGEWGHPRPPLHFETSLPGVFASGDVRRGSVKRLSAAVGEGAVAVQDLHTSGRLRRALAEVDFSMLALPAGRIRKKASVTAHLPKGVAAHRRHKALPASPLPVSRAA